MRQVSEAMVKRMVSLRRRGMNLTDIGLELGVHRETVRKYLKTYQPHGGVKGTPPPAQPVGQVIDRTDVDGSVDILKLERPVTVDELMQACKLDRSRWIPQFFRGNCWQGFYKLNDGSGHKRVQLYQSRVVCKRVITEELEHALLQFVRENVTPLPTPDLHPDNGTRSSGEYLVVWGLWDAHFGAYAWNTEVGADWDVDIACRRVMNSVDDMIRELQLYPVRKILMPVGNDFLHFDSNRMQTAFGEHHLDCDTRFARVYLAGLRTLSYMIERAAEIAKEGLEVLYVPGNHDMSTSFTLCAALNERYRNDPRVVVDLKANPRKYRMHGGTLLGFGHGGKTAPAQLKLIFAEEAVHQWSKSTYREMQVGHTHQRRAQNFVGTLPANGLTIRTNPTLCNHDFWHHSKGLIGESMRSVEAWRYDTQGYRGSHVVWARDDKHPVAERTLKEVT